MPQRRIHLIFKTHLDIGFTDHSAKVRAQYHERFIPQALDTGEHFFAEDPAHPKFIWTTGAWLIWDHLETQDAAKVKRLERAIERGLIRWHALPYTTHSELMSPAVFRIGLRYGQELDRRFGKATIAAKLTDVPGHTIGIVPLLAEAGVRFLHVGVNSASPPPDVPDVFRWRAPGGEDVVVMYQKSYGETHFPEGFDEGLGFAHTNDNMGPQSVPQTVEAWREVADHHAGAEIVTSTLDDYGRILWDRRDQFPVVQQELADSWIHGAASDPDKIKRFLRLQRLYDSFGETRLTPGRLALGRGLGLVAEHTWGVDIKSYLRDETAWDRPAFEAARKSDFRFHYSEASWVEQRAYLDTGVAGLDAADRARADTDVADEPTDEASKWTVETDSATGDISLIRSPSGAELHGQNGSLLGYRYESYDAADAVALRDSYITNRYSWAILDFGKPGLERANSARSGTFVPRLVDGVPTLDPAAHAALGAPARVTYSWRPLDDHRLEISVELIDKPANRMPEASFVTFTPAGTGKWQFLKTGLWLDAGNVAPRGGAQLQAVFGVRRGNFELRPLDTPLVAPADAPFMRFHKQPVRFDAGLRFNLHNNKWGTNFPMWWGTERFTARYVLTLG